MTNESIIFDKNSVVYPPNEAVHDDGTVVRGETEAWDKYQDKHPQTEDTQGVTNV